MRNYCTIILISLFSAYAHADALRDLEVKCWSQVVDYDGSSLCQYLLVTGKIGQSDKISVRAVAAPDGNGAKTKEQAERACQAMGYSFVLRFEVETPRKDEDQVVIDGSLKGGSAFTSRGSFIQHLNCL